jgi:sugar phosphate isomerase/epimerase
VRVFPNDFHKEVAEEQTLAQIARALNEVGRFASDYGQLIEVENHGTVGRLPTLRKILDQVEARNVRVKLNSDARDAADFPARFALVTDRLGITLHTHEMPDDKFPYQLQADLLIDSGWDGWWLLEATTKVPDRVQALIEQREKWEQLVSRSLSRPS